MSNVQHMSSIIGGIVAEGDYTLLSPAHFGSGDSDTSDMQLIRHASGHAFIPGSSIAGICRAELTSRLLGWPSYRSPAAKEPKIVTYLFGSTNADFQSSLIVNDAELVSEPLNIKSFIRDGVAISSKSGIALDNFKFDMEVLPAGTIFKLRFELILREVHRQNLDDLRKAFFTVITGFTTDEWPIKMGARTNRGYGIGKVDQWLIREANFALPEDAAWWLLDRNPTEYKRIEDSSLLEDTRNWLKIGANFGIKSSMLVGSYPISPNEPDKTHTRNGSKAVIPGSALAGICRHRAERIIKTLSHNEETVTKLINSLFGPSPEKLKEITRDGTQTYPPINSRIIFDESIIEGGVEEIQSRIHIDPFTGGTVGGALFDEQAIWSGNPQQNKEATITLNISICEPRDLEIGLLLHVLKDLWLEDLPIGSGGAIGRGLLCGKNIIMKHHLNSSKSETFMFCRSDSSSVSYGNLIDSQISGLTSKQMEILEIYSEALVNECNEANSNAKH